MVFRIMTRRLRSPLTRRALINQTDYIPTPTRIVRFYAAADAGVDHDQYPYFDVFDPLEGDTSYARTANIHTRIEFQGTHNAALISTDAVITGLTTPAGIAFHPITGQGYLLESLTDALYKFNKTTGVVTERVGDAHQFGFRITRPRDLTFSPDGTLYMNSSGDGVYRLNLTTGVASRITEGFRGGIAGLSNGGIAYKDGIIYNSAYNHLFLYPQRIGYRPVLSHNLQKTFTAIEFSDDGFLYGISASDAALYKIDIVTGSVERANLAQEFGYGERSPTGFAFDTSGTAYMTGLTRTHISTIPELDVGFAQRVNENAENFSYDVNYRPSDFTYRKRDGTLKTVHIGVRRDSEPESTAITEFILPDIGIDEISYWGTSDSDFLPDDFEDDVLAPDKGISLFILGDGELQRITTESPAYIYRNVVADENYPAHSQIQTNFIDIDFIQHFRDGARTQLIWGVYDQLRDIIRNPPRGWQRSIPQTTQQIIYVDAVVYRETGIIISASNIQVYSRPAGLTGFGSGFGDGFE